MSYDQLVETVKRYWADTSRTREQTRDDLSALRDEVEILIETLGEE